ncbi:MAG TPA: OB-fold domain-containing protein [Mycobacteriales bacterium]|nr:OB-fold domain-containing protein [Mycobacteriales bacterium]HWA66501.1 OB-fold domain-containing protein [Mycobacteriales bacterium]
MRGVLGWGVHVPHRRLDRTQIAAVAGTGGGKGTRAVASYDEDSTTMAVEAGRACLASVDVSPQSLWFATTSPTYLDKTNATAIHAALRLDRAAAAYDSIGSVRSAVAALRGCFEAGKAALAVAGDVRIGRPGSADEAAGGDAAAALLVGDEADGPLLAELRGYACVTEEFIDRWRVPGDAGSKVWEERFGETKYAPLAAEALKTALGYAGIGPEDVDALVVAGLHERACAAAAKSSGVAAEKVVDRLAASVGNPGAAQPYLLLARALEQAEPGQTIVLLVLSDGADALVLTTTAAIATYAPRRLVGAEIIAGAPVSYGRYLSWRGLLEVEPPRRPEPARPSASAAGRSTDWKFGLEGAGGALADQRGTVTTFTVDRLAYSQSPPVVFAVVDFDDGRRLPVELTDVDADEVAIGMRVEMTFRRLFTADGIANYFWKARPTRAEDPS